MDYLRDPEAIYAKSFATIRAEADLSHIPQDAESIAIRMIHACGMVDLVEDIVISDGFAASAKQALVARAAVFVDAEMVRHGIIARNFPTGIDIICTLNDPRAKDIGLSRGMTRSAAAVDLWKDQMADSLVVIGNAPTALFRLLELLDEGVAKPAAIVACPVGFVGAAESKDELVKNSRNVPFVTVKGRRGGSAMAAAAVNALAGAA
jgi:precorrin-8X/cobalt-precorrin-8 methylmutase